MANERASGEQQSKSKSVGDRIRTIADRLQTSHTVQIKATSRILGAAAQLAQNHDRLIDEVSEMVNDDLRTSPQPSSEVHTLERLKQDFSSLKAAKHHFGITAKSWVALVNKLNAKPLDPMPKTSDNFEHRVTARLDSMERELQQVRTSLATISEQLTYLVEQTK